MLLINCEINFLPTCSANCVICEADRTTTFAIVGTKLYVPLVILSAQDNIKLLQQLKSRFKCAIQWYTLLSKISTQVRNQYLDYLIDARDFFCLTI